MPLHLFRTIYRQKIINMNKVISKMGSQKQLYYVYILKCEGDILYTGIATDYKRRFDEHSNVNGSKKGAKFTKSHKPEKIVAVWKTKNRSEASKLESRIKQLDKSDKLLLIGDNKYFKGYFVGLVDCRKYRRVV